MASCGYLFENTHARAQVAGNLDEAAPYVLDKLHEDRRSTFDNNLARVIATALEKRIERRYQSGDEMHDAVYACLVDRGEAVYRSDYYLLKRQNNIILSFLRIELTSL